MWIIPFILDIRSGDNDLDNLDDLRELVTNTMKEITQQCFEKASHVPLDEKIQFVLKIDE